MTTTVATRISQVYNYTSQLVILPTLLSLLVVWMVAMMLVVLVIYMCASSSSSSSSVSSTWSSSSSSSSPPTNVVCMHYCLLFSPSLHQPHRSNEFATKRNPFSTSLSLAGNSGRLTWVYKAPQQQISSRFQARSKDQEITRREVDLDRQVSPEEIMSIGRWNWAAKVGLLSLRVVRQQQCNGQSL